MVYGFSLELAGFIFFWDSDETNQNGGRVTWSNTTCSVVARKQREKKGPRKKLCPSKTHS